MRIFFAADVPPDPHSGAAGTEFRTVEALRRLGHEVDCVWADQLPHRIRHGNLHYLLELPAAYRDTLLDHCRRHDYDVFYVNQPHCYLAARAVRRRGRGGVFVQRSHGWEPRVNRVVSCWRRQWGQPEKRFPANLPTLALRRLLERHNHLAARYCDGTIVSCELCREYLLREHRVPADRVASIPQAAPPDYLEDPVAGDPRRRFRFLYVGQFAFVKGPNVLAEVIRILAGRFPQACFTWVCGAAHHPQVRALLREAAPRCELLPWVRQEELRRVYDEHGIFLFPSLFEGFGKAFLEAMARGLCVVASQEGGMRDLIRHGENGFLAPPGDADRTADLAAAVLQDPELFLRVGRAARQTAALYSWDRVARETVAFYQRLQALPPAP
jgi:glycosyltransferase involved in cell wall biosynthesis